jgi:3-hydroxybutyryl-CoA dehydrogenase
VAAGRLGFKSGEGFRAWSDAEMTALRRKLAAHLLAQRRLAQRTVSGT